MVLGLAEQFKRAPATCTESGGKGDPTCDTRQVIIDPGLGITVWGILTPHPGPLPVEGRGRRIASSVFPGRRFQSHPDEKARLRGGAGFYKLREG